MSTDSEFKDITRRLNGQSTSPLFFGFAEKPLRDFISGIGTQDLRMRINIQVHILLKLTKVTQDTVVLPFICSR